MTLKCQNLGKNGIENELKCIQKFLSRFHFFPCLDITMPFNAHLLTRYILKSGKFLNMNQWFIPSDFIKRILNYDCYGDNRLKRTSIATIAPPFIDSKHYNLFPFTPIGVDLLWFWLFLYLSSLVVYPCFVHSYVSTQKLVGIATEKRQNSIRVHHTIAFILFWEQTRHPSCRDFFYT